MREKSSPKKTVFNGTQMTQKTLPPPTVAQGTALPSLRHRLTFSQSSKGLVRPSLYGGE